MKLIGGLALKIKENLKFFLIIGIPILLKILDWWFEGKLSKFAPFLFKKFLYLNLLSIILIAGIILVLLYLYKRFRLPPISPKEKLQPIIEKAEEFNKEYENFIKFVSDVYEERYDFSEDEEKEYLDYHDRLKTLFLDMQSPLVRFLEQEYVVGRSRRRAHVLLGRIEECFISPNLREHFLKKQERPERNVYFKPIIEQFVSYLRSIK